MHMLQSEHLRLSASTDLQDRSGPEPPNWVKARVECSAARMLDQLWRQVEKDSLEWNRLHDTVRFIATSRVERDVYEFTVLHRDKRDAKVAFAWNAETRSIDVTSSAGSAFRVEFGVSAAGHSVYRVDGAELQTWEVARRALEDFLFTN